MSDPAPDASADFVFAGVPRGRRDLVLDLSGAVGMDVRAGEVRQVIALGDDIPALEATRADLAAAGIDNVTFMRGNVTSLPFLDGSFRSVLWRFDLHHCADPAPVLSEIRRVLAPRGWLGLADLVVSEETATGETQNRIERLSDPSHTRALSASELQDLLVRSGFEVTGAQTQAFRQPLEPWLERSGAAAVAAEEIRTLMHAELNGSGPPTGFAPRCDAHGEISILQTLTALLVLNING